MNYGVHVASFPGPRHLSCNQNWCGPGNKASVHSFQSVPVYIYQFQVCHGIPYEVQHKTPTSPEMILSNRNCCLSNHFTTHHSVSSFC